MNKDKELIEELKDAVDTVLFQSGELSGFRSFLIWNALKNDSTPEMVVESENQMGGVGGSGIIAVLHDAIDPDNEEFWKLVDESGCCEADGCFDEDKFLSFLKDHSK